MSNSDALVGSTTNGAYAQTPFSWVADKPLQSNSPNGHYTTVFTES